MWIALQVIVSPRSWMHQSKRHCCIPRCSVQARKLVLNRSTMLSSVPRGSKLGPATRVCINSSTWLEQSREALRTFILKCRFIPRYEEAVFLKVELLSNSTKYVSHYPDIIKYRPSIKALSFGSLGSPSHVRSEIRFLVHQPRGLLWNSGFLSR